MRKACTLELVGLQGFATLTPFREVSDIDHMLTNLQPLVTRHAIVAKTNQKSHGKKKQLNDPKTVLGFLRTQEVNKAYLK